MGYYVGVKPLNVEKSWIGMYGIPPRWIKFQNFHGPVLSAERGAPAMRRQCEKMYAVL